MNEDPTVPVPIRALRDAWSRLCEARSYVLACHQRPDGDALGSALALAHILRAMGKDVTVICEDEVPANYTFIPESEMIVTQTDRRDFDMGVLVDSEGPDRVGSAADAVTSARMTACIDHHVPNGEFGQIRIIDQTAASTAEVVIDLFDANQVPIDAAAATQLMTGVVADTGAFKFPNTTARTFRTAARLTELGAKPSMIVREVFENRPLAAIRLLGRAISSLRVEKDGRLVMARLTMQDLKELGGTDADTEGIVSQIGAVRGASSSILFREIEPDCIRVSLRSRGAINMDRVARAFGGGGHEAAAGCTLRMPLAEAERAVAEEVGKWMES